MATIKVDGVEIEYDPTPAEITTHVHSEDRARCEFSDPCREYAVSGFQFCLQHLYRINQANEERAR